MRKEYLPAILLYIASALFFIASVVLMFMKNIHWSTLIIIGVAVMLFASSQLVKIGNKLRESDEREESEKKSKIYE